MKLPHVLLALLLAMAAVIGAAMFIGERPLDAEGSPTGHGSAHPTEQVLLVGGDGAERIDYIWPLAVVLGLLQYMFFVGLLRLGAGSKPEAQRLNLPLSIGAGAVALMWIILCWVYRAYTQDPDPGLIGSLPAPTAVMVYGIWFVPLVFIFIYITMFNTAIYTPADAEKFRQILAASRADSDASGEQSVSGNAGASGEDHPGDARGEKD